jgi:Leucine Rich repeat
MRALNLTGNLVRAAGCTSLSNALPGSNIDMLKIASNSIQSEGLIALAAVMRECALV